VPLNLRRFTPEERTTERGTEAAKSASVLVCPEDFLAELRIALSRRPIALRAVGDRGRRLEGQTYP
jgi:hypothetical protein